MDDDAIRQAIQARLALPLVTAGRALGLGRRRSKAAAAAGQIPVTPAGTVPTSWLKQVLQIDRPIASKQPRRGRDKHESTIT